MRERYNIQILNRRMRELKIPYSIETEGKEIYLIHNGEIDSRTKESAKIKLNAIDYNQIGKRKEGDSILQTDEDGVFQISRLLFEHREELTNPRIDWNNPEAIYSELTKPQEINYGRGLEKTIEISLIGTSMLLIALSSFKLTGNVIGASTTLTNYSIFALLGILIFLIILFINNKKKSR